MDTTNQRKRSLGLSSMLAFLALVYVLGIVYLLLSWAGIQSYDPAIWQHDALPLYALVFLLATAGIFGVGKWKKWGVYGLAGAWVLTGILDSLFAPPAPLPYKYSFFAVLIVIAFFLLLLPAWRDMD